MIAPPRGAPSVVVEPFGPEHLEAFRALFEASASPCFCRYWHFEGTKNEWLDRCAHRPQESFEEQAEAARRSDPSARGLVAREARQAQRDGELVGWMKLAPTSTVPKLRSLAVYRAAGASDARDAPGAPGDGATYSVCCFLVHPRARRRGVARALLVAAETHVRAWGGRVIEAYPRRSAEPLYDEEVFQGPEALFRDLGYVPILEAPSRAGSGGPRGDERLPRLGIVAPYPVYRKIIEPSPT